MASIPTISSRATPAELQRFARAVKNFLDSGEFKLDTTAISKQIDRAIRDYEEQTTDLTPPGPPVELVVTGLFDKIMLEWGPATGNVAYYEVFRNMEDDLGNAAMVSPRIGAAMWVDTPPDSSLSATYYYWVRAVSPAGIAGPFNAAAGTPGSTANDPAYLLEVLAGQLGYGQFDVANGVFPVRLWTGANLPVLPNAELWPPGSIILWSKDGKIYRTENGQVWKKSIEAVDIDGQLIAEQIADAAINTAKFASGIEPVAIVDVLPSPRGYTGPKTVLLTSDSSLYRYDVGVAAWTKAVQATDVSGQITETQITNGAISTAKLSAGAVTASKILANTITAGQIAAGAISATEIAANAITASKIYADAVTTEKIKAGAITTTKIATAAITANKVAANAITAINIQAGAVTAGKIAAGAILADKIGANEVITNTANISNGIITNAKIKDLAANKITAGTITAAITTIGQYLRSSDSTVELDMANKFLRMKSADGSYVQVEPGELRFVHNGSTYFALRRIDTGVAANGTTVVFNPPFRSAPHVICSVKNFPTYDPYYGGLTLYQNMQAKNISQTGFDVECFLSSSGLSYRTYSTPSSHFSPTDGSYHQAAYATFTCPDTDVTKIGLRISNYVYYSDLDRYLWYDSKVEVFNGQTGTWSQVFYGEVNDTQKLIESGTLPAGYTHKMRVIGVGTGLGNAEIVSAIVYTNGTDALVEGDVTWMAIE